MFSFKWLPAGNREALELNFMLTLLRRTEAAFEGPSWGQSWRKMKQGIEIICNLIKVEGLENVKLDFIII